MNRNRIVLHYTEPDYNGVEHDIVLEPQSFFFGFLSGGEVSMFFRKSEFAEINEKLAFLGDSAHYTLDTSPEACWKDARLIPWGQFRLLCRDVFFTIQSVDEKQKHVIVKHFDKRQIEFALEDRTEDGNVSWHFPTNCGRGSDFRFPSAEFESVHMTHMGFDYELWCFETFGHTHREINPLPYGFVEKQELMEQAATGAKS